MNRNLLITYLLETPSPPLPWTYRVTSIYMYNITHRETNFHLNYIYKYRYISSYCEISNYSRNLYIYALHLCILLPNLAIDSKRGKKRHFILWYQWAIVFIVWILIMQSEKFSAKSDIILHKKRKKWIRIRS